MSAGPDVAALIAALLANVPAMVILTGLLVAWAAALIGVFLVVRGESLLTDAIAHAALFGIVMVWLMTGQRSGALTLVGAGFAGVGVVLGAQALARTGLVRQDTATGLAFPALFAAAILIIGLNARSIHLDAHSALLGEIGFVWLDTVALAGFAVPRAVVWLALMLALNALFVALFWKELKLAAFDPALAQFQGLKPNLLTTLLLVLTSATAVAAFDAVGVVLFIAFVIVPAAAARLLTNRLSSMLAFALLIGTVAVFSGHAAAVRFDASIAPMMAVAAGALFAVVLVASPQSGLVAALLRKRASRNAADRRALLAHIGHHADTRRAADENTEPAIGTHFSWARRRTGRAVGTALDDGLLVRDGAELVLTAEGQASIPPALRPQEDRQ
ncbi:MAG: metal ABC transporter permease [Rhizobiaceae bacterium]|jgi:manganese/zinc/iron transport system permease protein|nr:metal ABC transporter permease [Rhizobiaceae bacterium]